MLNLTILIKIRIFIKFVFLSGFLSWDLSDCHVDLEDELNTITQNAPEGEEARHGKYTNIILLKDIFSISKEFHMCLTT